MPNKPMGRCSETLGFRENKWKPQEMPLHTHQHGFYQNHKAPQVGLAEWL
jgi:hypothetical protein